MWSIVQLLWYHLWELYVYMTVYHLSVTISCTMYMFSLSLSLSFSSLFLHTVEYTRVSLHPIEGVEGSDYINANYIMVSCSHRCTGMCTPLPYIMQTLSYNCTHVCHSQSHTHTHTHTHTNAHNSDMDSPWFFWYLS